MKPEAQRIAIAEACGWGLVPNYAKVGLYGYHNRQPSYDVAECPPAAIPDYLTDLNAMHEAEKTLTDGQWLIYEHALQSPSALRGDYSHRHIIHGTAAQRAEAFLRSIGRWIEA